MTSRTHIPALNLTAAQAVRTLGLASNFASQIGTGLTALNASKLSLVKSLLGGLDLSRILGGKVKQLPHFPPHRKCCHPHVRCTYFKRETVGRKTSAKEIAEIQDLNIGLPRKINDTLEKKAAAKMIAASYQRPIRLKNGKWLSRGMIYNSYRDLVADRADGTQGGVATVQYGPGGRRPVVNSFLARRPVSELNKQYGGCCFRPHPGWIDVRPTPGFPVFPPFSPGFPVGTLPTLPGRIPTPRPVPTPFPGPIGPITGGSVNDRLLSAFGPAIGKADSDIQSLMRKVQANPNDQMARFQLQQAMQRRTELITLLTNLMKSEHDARMAIARNVRV